jgi:hypothetical protein
MFRGKKSPRRSGDDRDSRRASLVPDEIKGYINDVGDIAEQLQKGRVIHDSEADEFDQFFTNMFAESVKSKDGVVHEVLLTDEFFKVKLPRARTLKRLVDVTTPKINEPVESDGYVLGAQVWNVNRSISALPSHCVVFYVGS